MTELLLVRHAETEWNREGRWQGHADPPLNEAGRAQAQALARSLVGERVDAIYSSDLRRAAETAEILAAALGLPVTTDPDLREIDVGSWSGLTREEVAVQFPDWDTHDGETREALEVRVVAAVRLIAQRHPDGQVLVVTHGGSIRSLQRHLDGEPAPVLANCEVYRLQFDG
ncbi:MAG TPA: histidine phosphatase family protein [Gaiellaceae bacterium]|nr:histidine phosphatase family protein [Gaiellaceae bacterium]